MLHSFVVARLLPRVPAWATYGQRVAPSLVTKPFLALHLHPNAVEDFVFRKPDLFVVSRKKPSLPGSEYFILNANSTATANSLTVVPPLPFKEPLYLSITPRITATFPNTKEYERLLKAEKYQLDETSVNKFKKALEEAGPSIPAIAYTGGDDEPDFKWDTWSAESAKEENGSLNFDRYLEFFFDLLPFDKLPKDFETSVFDETLLLRQLTLDYTWEGCNLITAYIEQLRKTLKNAPLIAALGTTFRPPILLSDQYRSPDPLVDSQRACTAHLQSLPIVHDGDPNFVKEVQLADDLRDDVPILELHVAERIPAVIANDVKTVLFDCNCLIDRDGPLQDALTRIFPPSTHLYSAQQLLNLYVEYETLRVADGLPESPVAAVQKIARYIGVSLEDSSAEDILGHYAKPRLALGVQDLITSLVEHGYTLVGIPSTAPLGLVSQIRGLSLDLFAIAARNPPLTVNNIISFCKKFNPTIRLDQIVVVTPDLYFIGESASRAGLPIVHFALMNTRSSTLSIPTIIPTYTLRCFNELLPMLRDPASVPAPREPPKILTPPFRIHDSYQCTFLLGVGSFAWVWNGVQVHTGAGVAVKFELIGHPSDPETLPYEAAIYEQLEGVPGIPRVHWSGKDMNANMVMDKLGPNLGQLRHFCRGRLGLKTVVMLGEQMDVAYPTLVPSASSLPSVSSTLPIHSGLVDSIIYAVVSLLSSKTYEELVSKTDALVSASSQSLDALTGCGCVGDLGLDSLLGNLLQIVGAALGLQDYCHNHSAPPHGSLPPHGTPTVPLSSPGSPSTTEPSSGTPTNAGSDEPLVVGLTKLLNELGLDIKADVVVDLLGNNLDHSLNALLNGLGIGPNGARRRFVRRSDRS